MENELFRYFLRKTCKVLDATNSECDEINAKFTAYLNERCTPEQLQNFMPKSTIDVVMQCDAPFKMNGFHPALVYHFGEFVEHIKQQYYNTK